MPIALESHKDLPSTIRRTPPAATEADDDLLATCCARVVALEMGFAAIARQIPGERTPIVDLFDELAEAVVDDYLRRRVSTRQVDLVRASLGDVRRLLE